MAFDTKLADRVRKGLGKRSKLTEKKMFGGIAFIVNGNMCCGVRGQEMIVRIDPEETEKVLAERHTRIFDISGRPMQGWILVHLKGLTTDAALAKWINLGVAYAESLKPK